MSIRRDSEPLADVPVGGARTAYGRSLEEATERLAKVAVASSVPLTHVARPTCVPETSSRASAVRDAQVRSICIDFNAPTSLSVRPRPTATESIFAEQHAPAAQLARPASAVAALMENRARPQCPTEAQPPAPPGMPRDVWNSDPKIVRAKTMFGPALAGVSAVDYMQTWWYTLGDEDYRTERMARFDPETEAVQPEATPTQVPIRAPVVDIQRAWNWFHDTTYIEGGNHVPLRIAYQTLPDASIPSEGEITKTDLMGPLEQTLGADLTDYDYTERSQYEYVASTIDVPASHKEDFKGIHAVMTEYLMSEWMLFLYEPVSENQPKHRFHVMFNAWAARAKKDLENVGMFLPEHGRGRRGAAGREPRLSEKEAAEEAERQTLLAGDYANFLKDFTIVIQDRISSLVRWVVSYFLTAPLDSSPVLAAARAYTNGFWIDYAKTKNTSHIYGPPAGGGEAPTSQARFAEWATLPQQSPLWDGDPYRFVSGDLPSGVLESDSDPVVSTVGPPSPGTLHEFLFGVVLNRWLPWTLERIAGEVVTTCPGGPVDCMSPPLGTRRTPALVAEEDALFCEWTRVFCAAADANRGSWSLTRADLRFRNEPDGLVARAALRVAVVFS